MSVGSKPAMSRDLRSLGGRSGRKSLEDRFTKHGIRNPSEVTTGSIMGSLPLTVSSFASAGPFAPASIESLVPFVPNLVAKAILEQCTCVDDTRHRLTSGVQGQNAKEVGVGDELHDAALEVFCTSASVEGISLNKVF